MTQKQDPPSRVVREVSGKNLREASPSDREAYAEALVQRINRITTEEMPKGMGTFPEVWRPLISADRQFCQAVEQYIRGEVKREGVDKAAIRLLHLWRGQANVFRREEGYLRGKRGA